MWLFQGNLGWYSGGSGLRGTRFSLLIFLRWSLHDGSDCGELSAGKRRRWWRIIVGIFEWSRMHIGLVRKWGHGRPSAWVILSWISRRLKALPARSLDRLGCRAEGVEPQGFVGCICRRGSGPQPLSCDGHREGCDGQVLRETRGWRFITWQILRKSRRELPLRFSNWLGY